MPAGMSKRVLNTSRYIKKADVIYWKVHILFVIKANFAMDGLLNFELNGVSDDGSLVGVASEKQHEVPETTVMRDIISSMMQTNAVRMSYERPLASSPNKAAEQPIDTALFTAIAEPNFITCVLFA